jgi:hypothetical protein
MAKGRKGPPGKGQGRGAREEASSDDDSGGEEKAATERRVRAQSATAGMMPPSDSDSDSDSDAEPAAAAGGPRGKPSAPKGQPATAGQMPPSDDDEDDDEDDEDDEDEEEASAPRAQRCAVARGCGRGLRTGVGLVACMSRAAALLPAARTHAAREHARAWCTHACLRSSVIYVWLSIFPASR